MFVVTLRMNKENKNQNKPYDVMAADDKPSFHRQVRNLKEPGETVSPNAEPEEGIVVKGKVRVTGPTEEEYEEHMRAHSLQELVRSLCTRQMQRGLTQEGCKRQECNRRMSGPRDKLHLPQR